MSDTALDAIFEAWTAGGDTRLADAQAASDTYITANPDLFTGYASSEQDDLVEQLETFRNAVKAEGDWADDTWRRVQVWLWHKFDPKNIGGVADAIIRTPPTDGEPRTTKKAARSHV